LLYDYLFVEQPKIFAVFLHLDLNLNAQGLSPRKGTILRHVQTGSLSRRMATERG
jgi:hypothetical protein